MACERILVVEDEDLIRIILAEVLADEGFHVSEASTGDEAVVLINSPDGFHAVVTDIHMPGTRDGIAVGQHARSHHPTIPVIYCTGRPDVLDSMHQGCSTLNSDGCGASDLPQPNDEASRTGRDGIPKSANV